jgi:hypothetical protein
MEFMPLILNFSAVNIQLIHQVLHQVHLESLCALSCVVNYKARYLCWSILAYQLPCHQLACKAHYANFNRSYLVASRTFLNIAIGLFDLLCKSVVYDLSRIVLMGIRALHAKPDDHIHQRRMNSYAMI